MDVFVLLMIFLLLVAEEVEFLATAEAAAEAEFTFLMEHLEQLVLLKTLIAEQSQFK